MVPAAGVVKPRTTERRPEFADHEDVAQEL